ncbi:hypothetical protein XFF6166_10064 [Xanthomonas citri pv. fuscans]|nr:hypothetical protein XFF6166_10064 [Xanthomonas citri pv. fuscans]SON94555.1 hypothetical protein XFF6990_140493 [Xanthomonas citri pv. fuscans]SOO02323.1 hypothetical protein XFF6960_590139 [Xanthomonas citri pv. fuscans]SOO06657.1 hypothetical protein XFF7767_80065 [Xanthomonas citri pv. fuscans]SOO11220.1 hypothetical protein XFF6970_70151 [Xanthomonas citri pv. fuscans]
MKTCATIQTASERALYRMQDACALRAVLSQQTLLHVLVHLTNSRCAIHAQPTENTARWCRSCGLFGFRRACCATEAA